MSTKSTRSSGTQITQRGVNQGNVLVDPVTGLPVDVIKDNANIRRLAVDANLTVDSVTVETDDLNPHDDHVAIGDPNNSNTVKVNNDGSIDVNCAISASSDTIAIADATSGNKLHVNPDGTINVNVVTTEVGTYKSVYNEISSVVSGTLTQIISYTTPPATVAKLQKVVVSGSNFATYSVLLNASKIDSKRSYNGDSLNQEFDFSDFSETGLPLTAGDVIAIKVIHSRPYVGDFNARIQVIEG